MAAGTTASSFRHAAIIGSAAIFCMQFSMMGTNPIAVAPIVILVGVYTATSRHSLAVVVLCCGAFAASLGSYRNLIEAALLSSTGVFIGIGARRNWSYGRTQAMAVAWMFVSSASAMFLSGGWHFWQSQGGEAYRRLEEWVVKMGGDQAQLELFLNRARFVLVEHYADFSLGSQFSLIFIIVTLCQTVTVRWVRLRYAQPATSTEFDRTRTPEWLVWALILLAGCWFLERQWPNDILRAFTWNSLVGLLAVYWLNGFSVLLYAFRRVRPSIFLALAMFLCVISWGYSLLSVVGLFDTWYNFREKADKLAALRDKLRDGSDD